MKPNKRDELKEKIRRQLNNFCSSEDNDQERNYFTDTIATLFDTYTEKECKKSILTELEEIVLGNYCEDLGTYDFDGIAEIVLGRINELKKGIKVV